MLYPIKKFASVAVTMAGNRQMYEYDDRCEHGSPHILHLIILLRSGRITQSPKIPVAALQMPENTVCAQHS